jgi:cobalt-zinc-cadmium efflux system outer membrane protein
VAVRVNTGESPRFELIKADTELLNAQKAAESASLRIAQARSAARRGRADAAGGFPGRRQPRRSPAVPPSMSCGPKCWPATPSLRSQAEVRRAERQLELERLRRQPELALKVAEERDASCATALGVVAACRSGTVAGAGGRGRRPAARAAATGPARS